MINSSNNSLTGREARVIEEATRWQLRARETLSSQEKAEFLQWLRASPEHAAAMDIVARSWDLSAEAARTKAVGPELLRARRLSLMGSSQEAGRRPIAARILARVRAGVIATTAFATVVGVAWGVVSVEAIYATGPGDQLSVTLADGTRLELAGRTRVEVNFGLFRRRVRMIGGEAELDVGKDLWRPFRLDARDVEIRDLGTRFTVRQRGGTLRVVLMQGRLELRDTTAGKLLGQLAPGEQATVADHTRIAIERADMVALQVSREGSLILKNASLTDALEEFRARTPVEISIADPALGRLKISGVYRISDASGFIAAVCALYPVAWRKVGPERFELLRGERPAP